MSALSRRTTGDGGSRRRSRVPLSRRFTYRYVLVLFVLAAIAVAWKVTIDASAQKIQNLTKVANAAALQPMHLASTVESAQKVALSSQPTTTDRGNLTTAAKQLHQYQTALIEGDSALGVPQLALDSRLESLYHEPGKLSQTIDEITEDANAIANDTGNVDAKAQRFASITDAREEANKGLDAALKIYNDMIAAELRSQQTNNSIMLGIFIFATVLMGVVVFSRLGRDIHLETTQLEDAERVHRENNERQTFRNELSQALEVTDSEGEVLAAVGRAFMTVIPDNQVELLLQDASGSHLKVAQISPSRGAAGCPVDSPQGCAAIRRGQSVVYESSRMLNVCPKLPEHEQGVCSAVCTPVMFMGTSLGVLHTVGPDGQPPSHTEIERLTVLASETGNRLGLLRHSHATELQATTDGLTGLLNRRTLEAKARGFLLDDQNFSVAMADLDHFKKLNDQHGHEAGDRALRLFASVLKSSLRPEDICARYGGEEFIVLLPSTTIAEAIRALERLQSALATEVAKGGTVSFTASWGLTDSSSGTTFDEIVAVADAALYSAKRSGRDCIMVDGEAAEAAGLQTSEQRIATPRPDGAVAEGGPDLAKALTPTPPAVRPTNADGTPAPVAPRPVKPVKPVPAIGKEDEQLVEIDVDML